MLKSHVCKSAHGFAVINATSPKEALKLLKDYEGEDEFLSFNRTPERITPLSDKEGVVEYMVQG